ncbi:MAG TPA: aspartate aminotransferase family protein [Alphaproteobacteria bacterium]|nr:aspartate aminotransferase family protein [Alphaproteobacteria bacterium]
MTHVFHRSTLSAPPVAVRGEGITLADASGKTYIDASGGAAVSCLGHGHPRVIRALQAQAARLAYAHTGFFTTEVAEQLADRLIAEAPPGIEKVYFVSGGSEAVEAALKLARQYFLETGEPERRRFISRRQSYHGNTLGALAVGGNQLRREPYSPLLMDVSLIAPCFAYRFKRDDESEAEYGRRVADELEAELRRLGPESVAAFIAEPVVGATAGAVTAVPGYFKRIREICDRYGILLILDEVMCGMGRTGTLHACTQEGIAPDLMVVAKGLGGGYEPIGAMLVSGRIYDAIAHGSGAFMHGHTYMAHAMACAASLAVLDTIRDERLLENVATMGRHLSQRLTERFGNHHHVGDIRGRGLLQAIELVAERSTKRPFDPDLKLHAKVKAEAMARGLMVYPMGGTIDGKFGDHVLLAPPYIATAADIERIVERLGDAVDAAIEKARLR